VQGCGGVDHVACVIEDWRDTRLIMEDVHEVRCSRQVWWFGPQNHTTLWMPGFAEFGSQNSAVAVLEGSGGSTRCDCGGCVNAKQLRMKDVTALQEY
jgi:hypothetical protein